jgi:hypothetical protein
VALRSASESAPCSCEQWLEKAQNHSEIMQNNTENTEIKNTALALLCAVTYSALA